MADHPGTSADVPPAEHRQSGRRRRVRVALAVLLAVPVVFLAARGVKFNLDRPVNGKVYDDVMAVPRERACSSFHTIDAGGSRWYEAWGPPAPAAAQFGEFAKLNDGYARGRLRILAAPDGGFFSQQAPVDGRDFAEFDVGAARYLFTGERPLGCPVA